MAGFSAGTLRGPGKNIIIVKIGSDEVKLYENLYKEDKINVFKGDRFSLIDGKYKNSRGWSADGTYQFIIKADGGFVLGQGGHIDLARGENVQYAGEVRFKKGKLIEWSNRSGHYEPDSSDASKFIETLRKNGLKDVNMDNFKPIKQ